MTELVIHGRGGQGGVTLAKLIATAFFLKGRQAQAFGVYAAERAGAPVQAFVRIDDREITNYNQIDSPDHVIVLDRTLIGPGIVLGHKPDGWMILNTAAAPETFAELLSGRGVATIDATTLALDHGLGTQTTPIVNTIMFGAVARVLRLAWKDVQAALASSKLAGPNEIAALRAFEHVSLARLAGTATLQTRTARAPAVTDLLDECVGAAPRLQAGDWATRRPSHDNMTPPCNHVCPAGNDVRGFVQAVGRGEFTRAREILLESSPLPGVCGRVCPAPCMDACNRREFDECVNVRELERAAADRGTLLEPTLLWRDSRVGVIGSGPAGLSAAYHLARLGYPVTIFESTGELGGVLRHGIPPYRLPREVLDAEIRHILVHGVTVEKKHAVDRPELLRLSKQFAALFVATGLQKLQNLHLGARTGSMVMQGLDFLDQARTGQVSLGREDVVVIGGGNTATDAARTARRLGARSVRILYRRNREAMPAIPEEVDQALEEGVGLDELVMPLRISDDGTRPVLTCTRMRLGDPDESGRPRPVPDLSEDAYFDVRCDRVILALGQATDLTMLPEGAEVREGRDVAGITACPMFAGGDIATNEGTVAAAIGSGRRAAWHIHEQLTGECLFPKATPPVAGASAIAMDVFAHSASQHGALLPSELRRHGFSEVRLGFDAHLIGDPAVIEAQRCFSCGVCTQCDRCVQYCPEGTLVRNGDGFRFDYAQCKGCGICASQCPRGVIVMSEL